MKKFWNLLDKLFIFSLPLKSTEPAWKNVGLKIFDGLIVHAAIYHSYKIDMKTLDTKDEIWHKMYV